MIIRLELLHMLIMPPDIRVKTAALKRNCAASSAHRLHRAVEIIQ